MIKQKAIPLVEAPSMASILIATVVAVLIAAVLLFVAVLPAEYGIDPLKSGKALGLTDLSNASGKLQVPEAIADATIMPILDPGEQPSKWGSSVTMKGAFITRPGRFNVDSREFTLKPGEGLEIKYNMKKGSGLVFSWVASGKLLYDFHGQPDLPPPGKTAGSDYFESYERDDKVGKDQFHGTLIAPSTGIHGWFWENSSQDEIKVRLISSGFYDWVFENVHDKESALKPMDAYSLPSHPTVPDEPFR